MAEEKPTIRDVIIEGLPVVVMSSVIWVPLFGFIAAVFIDGIFGTKILEVLKSLGG